MKSKQFCTVYETTDHNAFKTLKGNRTLNQAHIKRIAKSKVSFKYLPNLKVA